MTSVLPVPASQPHLLSRLGLRSRHEYAYEIRGQRRALREITNEEGNMTGRGRGKGRGKGKVTAKAQTQEQTQTANATKQAGRRARVVDFDFEDELEEDSTVTMANGGVGSKSKGKTASACAKTSKRKAVEYEEDIEGFQFSRAPGAKRLRSSPELESEVEAESPEPEPEPVRKQKKQPATRKRGRPPMSASPTPPVEDPPAKTQAKTQTQTQTQSKAKPKPKARQNNRREVAVAVEVPAPAPTNGHAGSRRSKRLADEVATEEAKPASRTRRRISSPDVQPQPVQVAKKRTEQRTRTPEPEPEPADDYIEDENEIEEEDGEVTLRVQAATTSTKIALPMADTPVIRKNKEMRMKDKKKPGAQRRSSLGMRGRRASSLIDSGVSNALPHDAVRTADFYKHIEGEGLPEPRRMKQLLTWCATRALGEKPSGSRSEDESARLAARVIQEELLKDLGTRSELSDWFGRQESTPPPVVVKKPNPKNLQNAEKLRDLEEHIQRLQEERKSLAALLKDPVIPRVKKAPDEDARIDTSLLDPSQRNILTSLNLSPSQPESKPQENSSQTDIPALSSRLSSLSLSLTPTLDSFAAGTHDIEVYRRTGADFASAVLRVCAERLEERDKRIRGKMKENGDGHDDGERGGGGGGEEEDLSVVLGALSRLERRM